MENLTPHQVWRIICKQGHIEHIGELLGIE